MAFLSAADSIPIHTDIDSNLSKPILWKDNINSYQHDLPHTEKIRHITHLKIYNKRDDKIENYPLILTMSGKLYMISIQNNKSKFILVSDSDPPIEYIYVDKGILYGSEKKKPGKKTQIKQINISEFIPELPLIEQFTVPEYNKMSKTEKVISVIISLILIMIILKMFKVL